MIPHLRGRLLISYTLLLLITLAVMTAALILFLFAQPPSPMPTYERLGFVTSDVISATGLNAASRPSLTALRTLANQMTQLATENNVRLLLVNMQTGRILYDSAGRLQRGDSLQTEVETFTGSVYLQRALARLEPVFGHFSDSDGTWLFSGVAVVRQGTETNALLTADHQPQQTLSAVLEAFLRDLALPLCQAALIGLLVSALLAALISRGLVRGLEALERGAAAVASGESGVTIPEEGPRELRTVAAAFNRMTAQVQDTQQAQRDFVANVSHDLKTPLTSIQGYSQAIMDGAAKDPARAAGIIHEEAARMNRMVTELTDLARLQAGRLSMHSAPVDMGQLTAVIGERVAVLARDKSITLHVAAAPLPPIAGDGDRLAQVLTNLTGNAIKYTPAGGEVWLSATIESGGVVVTVRDTGIGLAPEELPRIFERFYQVDKARGPKRGTGLGLAITQEIVQAHGGRISVHSDGLGKGSTFRVWLPSPQVSTLVRRR